MFDRLVGSFTGAGPLSIITRNGVISAAREKAFPENRNALAALVFKSVEIKDDRVMAVVVQPANAPFFAVFGQQEPPTEGPGVLVAGKCLDQAEVTGFEPAISALTGLHVRPLHHASAARVDDV